MESLDVVTKVLAVAGGVSSLLTLLAAVMPAEWQATQLCARIGADIRGILSRVK